MTQRTFTYQWQRRVNGVWTEIDAATSRNYTPVSGDNGLLLRLGVKPSDGDAYTYSNATDPVLAPLLLQVEFTSDASPPIGSYAGEVGSLTVVDSTSLVSVSSSQIATSAPAFATGDPALYSPNGLARVAGRTFRATWTAQADGGTTSSPLLGWLNSIAGSPVASGSAFYAVRGSGTSLIAHTAAAVPITPATFTPGTLNTYDLVLRGTGMFLFQDKRLIWVFTNGAETPMYPAVGTVGAGRGFKVGTMHVRDLPTPFDSDYGIAIVHETAPVSSTIYNGTADAIIDGAFTLPAGSANLVAYELRYNVADSSNYNAVQVKRNAGNTAWDLVKVKVVAGSSSSLGTTTTGVGTPDTVRVIHTGSTHDFYTAASTTFTKRGTQVTDANQSTSAGVAAVLGAGATMGTLDCWANNDTTNYAILDRT